MLAISVARDASAQYGRLGGVVKAEDNQPIKGATVLADNQDVGQSFTATSDDKGRFIIIGLRAGTWRVVAQAPGFEVAGGSVQVRLSSGNAPVLLVLKKTGAPQFGALGGIAAKDLQAGLAAAERSFTQGRWDEAVQAYRIILDRAPTLTAIHLQIAAAYRSKQDYTSAITAYRALLAAEPDNEKAHIGIAVVNLERGDSKAAETALLAAAEGTSVGREIFYQLGELKLAGNQMDEAVRWYKKAAAADPTWGKPVYKLGLSAIRQADTAGATKLMAQVIAIDPGSPEAALAKSSLESLK
jgi:tetratricopeptide (TPR) repeat protein